MGEFSPKTPAEMRKLAEAATRHDYGGWKYRGPSDCLHSGWVTGSEGSPVLATVQWPVPTMDRALLDHDASQPVGELIAACSPSQLTAMCDLIEAQARRIEELTGALVKCADALEEIGGGGCGLHCSMESEYDYGSEIAEARALLSTPGAS